MNLWSALECLTTRDDVDSIMGSVCAAVVPIVTWRRNAKILSYTSKNLLEFRELSGGSFGSGFPTEENGLSNERLMLALAKPEGHAHPEELQLFVKDHALLGFRVYSLWKTISNPFELAKELKLTSKRVEWQLYRIYRARNLIVHEGEEVPHVARLLENLHYYFSVTLSRILHSMQANPNWDVADSIVFWRTKHDYIINCLTKGRAHMLQAGDFQPFSKTILGKEKIWAEK